MKDNRDSRCCGNVQLGNERYVYATPRTLVELRNPAMRAYFEARLRGEHPALPAETPPGAT